MDAARRVALSRLLSFGLRHDPAALGLVLDSAGWAPVAAVLAGLAARGENVTAEELAEIVTTSDKQRFALSEDRRRIRANQGHSVGVDLGLVATAPPEILASRRVEDAIRREGLRAGQRTHVHLSADEATALVVARRREGPHVILRVRARAMSERGLPFYRSENGVWLTEHVPPEYVLP